MTVSVELNWDLSPTNPDDVDGQRVYRTTVENPTFAEDFTEIAELGDNATTYQDDDAPAGEEVTYAVTAFNEAGESEPTTTTIETAQTFERSVATGASGASSGSRQAASVRITATGATGASTTARATVRPRTATTGSAGASSAARALTSARATTTGTSGVSTSSRTNAVVRSGATGAAGASASARQIIRSRTAATGSAGASAATRALQYARSVTTGASGSATASARRANWRLGGVGLRVTRDLDAEAETLSVAAPIPSADRENVRELGDRAGDTDTEDGFGGAFRAFDRGGREPIDLEPPETDPLPFPAATPVFVDDFGESEAAPGRVDAEFELQRVTNRDDATDIDGTITTGDDWTLLLEQGTLALSKRQVGQLDREGSTPGASVTLPLILSDEQAAVLLDSVGYPAGVVVESVPDGPDQRVDETGGRQTIDLEAPAEAMIDAGEWYVIDWSLEKWSFSEDREWRVELTLAES